MWAPGPLHHGTNRPVSELILERPELVGGCSQTSYNALPSCRLRDNFLGRIVNEAPSLRHSIQALELRKRFMATNPQAKVASRALEFHFEETYPAPNCVNWREEPHPALEN